MGIISGICIRLTLFSTGIVLCRDVWSRPLQVFFGRSLYVADMPPRCHPSIHDRAVLSQHVLVNLAAIVQIPHIAAEHNQPGVILNDPQALARFG